MYAIYGNMDPINIPQSCEHFSTSTMDPSWVYSEILLTFNMFPVKLHFLVDRGPIFRQTQYVDCHRQIRGFHYHI